jgi:hypothetical protein
MDDMAEVQEEQQEITEALGGAMMGGDVMDDMDLLDELGELEEGMLDEDLAGMGSVPSALPAGYGAAGAPASSSS